MGCGRRWGALSGTVLCLFGQGEMVGFWLLVGLLGLGDFSQKLYSLSRVQERVFQRTFLMGPRKLSAVNVQLVKMLKKKKGYTEILLALFATAEGFLSGGQVASQRNC